MMITKFPALIIRKRNLNYFISSYIFLFILYSAYSYTAVFFFKIRFHFFFFFSLKLDLNRFKKGWLIIRTYARIYVRVCIPCSILRT